MGLLSLLVDHVIYRKREAEKERVKAEMEAKQKKREMAAKIQPMQMGEFSNLLHRNLTQPSPKKPKVVD